MIFIENQKLELPDPMFFVLVLVFVFVFSFKGKLLKVLLGFSVVDLKKIVCVCMTKSTAIGGFCLKITYLINIDKLTLNSWPTVLNSYLNQAYPKQLSL